MPITVQYQPNANLVGAAAYEAGLGEYRRYLDQLRLQQEEAVQRERMQQRDLAQNRYLAEQAISDAQFRQRYGVSADQYGQRVGISDVQYRQTRDIEAARQQQLANLANQQWATQYGTQADIYRSQLGEYGQNTRQRSQIQAQVDQQIRDIENQRYIQEQQIRDAQLRQERGIASDQWTTQYQGANSRYLTGYGAADAQYRQQVGIGADNQQQLASMYNQQYMQQQGFADAQYRQQQALMADYQNQVMSQQGQNARLGAQLSYNAQAAQFGAYANQQQAVLQSGLNYGNQSSLMGQQYGYQFGNQYALNQQEAALQQQFAQQRYQQQNFLGPYQNDYTTMSSRAFQQQMQAEQHRWQAIGNARRSGVIDDYQAAQAYQQVSANVAGIQQYAPNQTDVVRQVQQTTIPPGTNLGGQPTRFPMYSVGGKLDLTPDAQAGIDMYRLETQRLQNEQNYNLKLRQLSMPTLGGTPGQYSGDN